MPFGAVWDEYCRRAGCPLDGELYPAVAAYVDYYLGDGISAVTETGYVAIPEARLADATATWESRQTGSLASGG